MHCNVHRQCLFKRPDMCLGHRHWRLSESYKQKEVSLFSTLNSLLFILPLSGVSDKYILLLKYQYIATEKGNGRKEIQLLGFV